MNFDIASCVPLRYIFTVCCVHLLQTPYMSVVGQNKFGFLVHPISTFSGGELQLTETPHGKPSSAAQCTDKKKKKKKCRSTPLNHGEACLMAYHEKVREKLLNSWKSLVDLGKALKYFPTPVPMSLPDTSTMNPLGDKTDASLEDQQHVSSTDGSCTLQAACSSPGHENSVDLVDMCNQALVNPDIPDCKLLVLVGCHELDHMCGRIVHNFADHHVIMKHSKSNFYIPENSTFLLSDITQLHLLVDHVQSSRDLKYDCIVIDPPWENRSAIRSHKYSWLSENDLLQIPLPELCNEDCLVIIWVTNKVKFSDFVQNELFPQWSVKLAGEWHWIKVTTSGEFVFDLDSPHKKPYELLLLGKYHDKGMIIDRVGILFYQWSV